MVENSNVPLRRREAVYAAVFLLLLILRFVLNDADWTGSVSLHTLMEFVSASFAIFVGCLALVRFYTKKNNAYFFIGTGFLGAGLLDLYHAFIIGAFFDTLFPFLSAGEIPWSWNASPTFLAILIAGSWLIWHRESEFSVDEMRLYVAIGLVILLSTLFFALVPLPTAPTSEYFLGRVASVLAAVFFGISLVGYWHKGKWRTDPFEHWLLLALIVHFASQAFFMPFSQDLFDAMFDTAVLLKQIGYMFVLIGLLISMYSIFKQAEQAVAQQISANEALQREIYERKRVEAAELEQRKLAVALQEVGVALSSTLDFDKLLDILLDQTGQVLPYDTANVMLVKEEQIEIVVTRGYAADKTLQQPRRFPLSSMPSLRHMVKTQEPLIIPDTAEHELWVNAEVSPHVRSWAGAPIIVNREIIAFLALNYSQPDFYKPENTARLKDFAVQAAIAFENARLYKEVQKRVEELTTLKQISEAITSTLDLQETLTIVTENTTRLLRVAATSVVLVDEENGDLLFAAASGEASDFVQGKRLELGQGILGWVAQSGEPVLVPDVATDPRHFGEFDAESGFSARSILCVPLQTRGQTIGAIEAINKEVGTFDEEDQRLLTRLAVPAATAIENARLFTQSQQEIAERKRVEATLEAERSLLARRVEERTADLRAANAELARAARMKDEFLASISHELRTPLNAVLGISEALQDEVFGPMNENQLGSLRSIEESGRHLLALINDILDLSKVEAGKLELEVLPISVESVCQASLRLIKQNAHKKHLKIHTAYDSQVDEIMADERRVKQVLVNLLSNAVKFTPDKGDIGLEVAGDEEKGVVNITVWDTGIGISQADMKRLFQPFVQLDSRLAREFAGSGLGLSLVLRMMELHGGSVSVESELGTGSRFTVSFPWQGTEGVIHPEDAVHHGVPLATVFSSALVIEDSPTARAQVGRYLQEVGIQTLDQVRGDGAVEQALAVRPDLIILDIMLPDTSGWEILSRLQANPTTRTIPVIVTSVLEEQTKALAMGASCFLLKPITRSHTKDALYQVWRQMQTSYEAHATASQDKDKPLILLAEDNEINIKTFSNYLEAKGFAVVVARNGLDAVSLAKSEDPDLILMDIQMPQMSGLDAIRHIRTDEMIKPMPIIAVTALAMPGDREACLAAGANVYMSKPVSLKGLVETIRVQLRPAMIMEMGG